MAASNETSSTVMARVTLAGTSCDALRATNFTRQFPPHFHETFAIGVIEAGRVRLTTPRGEWFATSGDILAFSPGEVHSATPLGNGGYTYRMVYPTAAFMRAVGADAGTRDHMAPLFRKPVIQDSLLACAIQRAQTPLMDGCERESAGRALLAALRALARDHGAEQASSGSSCRPSDRDVVERVRRYLHAEYAQPIRVSGLASMCTIDQFQLIRIFRAVVGVPPHAYLVQLRVNRAQAMLRDGWSVADVAYSCGFADQSHLTKTFKRMVGVPPGQYLRVVCQGSVVRPRQKHRQCRQHR